MEIKKALPKTEEMGQVYDVSRRRFFRLAGGIAGAGVLLAACQPKSAPTDLFIGRNDIALLNFIFILQQLEAAFYTQAVSTPYYGLTTSESDCLTDVRDQEIAHREYFRTLLGNQAVPPIILNFSTVTFADRTSFLTHAYGLEDIVVQGLNGAASLFINTDYATMASKMATVEARHSAYFRQILKPNSFADATAVDVNGLDGTATPPVVLAKAMQYIESKFDSSKLPA